MTTKIFALLLAFGLCSGLSYAGQTVKPTHEHGPGTYQKPGAAISLGSPSAITMDPQSQKTVSISFNAAKEGVLTLYAKPKAGLVLVNEGEELSFDLSNEVPSIDLDLSSGETGVYHVMFHASIETGGSSSSRVFGIPVYVGEIEKSSAEKMKPHPNVIIMKGEETVH